MTLCRLRPSCLALVAALLAFAPPALAIPFSVVVPLRSPDLPISEVKVMFETPSPVAGQTVQIGTGSVPVPASGETAFTDTGGGDDFKVSGSGNNVTVTIRPKSMLNGANTCQYAVGAVGKEITMEWSGSINGYRLTSYGAPTVNACTCSSRRIKTTAAFVTGAPPGVNLGRFPTDVILVLDKSGSMSSATPGDPLTMSKWSALTWAVGQFIGTWEVEGLSPGSTAGGTGLTGDRMGLVMFSTTPEIVFIGSDTMVSRGTGAPGPTHAWQALITKLGTFSPGGATALGGGLKAAIQAKAPDRDLVVVMMTDGIQNVAPLVNDGSGTAAGFKVLDFGSGEEPIKDKCVPVLAVAMGTAASTQADLLDQVSQQTSGTVRQTVASSTDLTFLAALVELTKGSTMTKLAQTSGVLPPNTIQIGAATPPAPVPASSMTVQMDGTVKSGIAVLSWITTDPRLPAPALRITNPAGTVVSPVATASGQGFTVQRVDIPTSGKAGAWKVDVINSFHQGPLPFHLSVYANERSLDFGLRFAEINHGTGEPLTLTAQVSFDGKAMTGLTGLKLTRELPAGALGTILHDRKETGTPGGTDPLSPYDAKLAAALEDKDVLGKVGTTPQNDVITMTEAGGGRYTFVENNTSVPGIYRFHVTFDATTPGGEPIHRIETIEAVVEVLPTPQTKEIGTSVAVTNLGGGNHTFVVIPRDKFGNYAGPGKNVRLTTSSGRAAKATDQSVNGEYTIGLAGAEGDPLVAIAVGGRQVGNKKLSDWEKGVEPVSGPGEPGKVCAPGDNCCHCRAGGLLPAAGGMILLLGRRRRGKRSGLDGAPPA